jgi:PPOX class probable F420-dependent enzyme
MFRRAGHSPDLEQPAEVMEAVSDFLSAGVAVPVGRGSPVREVRAMPTIGWLGDHRVDEIPASHRDLVECPPVAALTTVTAQGYPQTSVVWCDFDGVCVRVNTMRGFAKERNMRANPRVTLCCYDPRHTLRYLEVRGRVVELTEAGAAAHLDQLASTYAGRPVRYFGEAIPAHFAKSEVPVLCRIRPDHVVAVDATGKKEARP